MPTIRKTKQTTILETRLAQADRMRFEILVKSTGKTRTELVRQAVLEFMDRQEGQELTARDTATLQAALRPIMEALDRHHERQASLLVRFGIDVGMMLAILSGRLPKGERKQIMDNAYKFSADRFSKRLNTVALEIKEMMTRRYGETKES